MRALALLMVIGVAACSPAPEATPAAPEPMSIPAAKALPSFDFRGLKPDTTTMADAVAAETVTRCSDSGSCEFTKYGIGDVGTGRSMVIFKDGKFDWFSVKMSPRSFEAVGRTLSSVYGAPCREDSRQLQNAFGATFSGDEVEWCFAEGHLILRRHSENDVTEGELDFFTYREPAPAKDYNSGNL
ncbi:MAG: hypothetical protein ACK4JY_03845 [Brevundimonas sp.]|uniref:hypothetical protein n=1 Tax=Brevundimonas sp. TaxID=1871086 RepID=UPI00391C23CC